MTAITDGKIGNLEATAQIEPALPLLASSELKTTYDLIASRAAKSIEILTIRDTAYDVFRTRGERISNVSDDLLSKQLAAVADCAIAEFESELCKLPEAIRGPLVGQILHTLIDDPNRSRRTVAPNEEPLLEQIELRMAGKLLQLFKSSIDLSDPDLCGAAERRLLRSIKAGSFAELENLSNFLPASTLKDPTVLNALEHEFKKTFEKKGEAKAISLLEHDPYIKMIPALLCSEPVKAIVSNHLINQLCVTQEPPKESVLKRPWAAEAFSLLPNVIDYVSDCLIGAGYSLNVDRANRFFQEIEGHPESKRIVDRARPFVEPTLLQRIRNGCRFGDESLASSVGSIAIKFGGPALLLQQNFQEAIGVGFRRLLEEKAPLFALMGQYSLLPPVHRDELLSPNDMRKKVSARVMESIDDLRRDIHVQRPKLDPIEFAEMLDLAEATVGWAVIELSLPFSILENFREFIHSKHPYMGTSKEPWWSRSREEGINPRKLEHFVSEYAILTESNVLIHELTRRIGKPLPPDLEFRVNRIHGAKYVADTLPAYHSILGKELLFSALRAPPESQATLLGCAIDWHLRYLTPDGAEMELCFEVASKLSKKQTGKAPSRDPFARLSAAIDAANPPADYELPLSSRRVEGLRLLAGEYRGVASRGNLEIPFDRSLLIKAAEWIQEKLNSQPKAQDRAI